MNKGSEKKNADTEPKQKKPRDKKKLLKVIVAILLVLTAIYNFVVYTSIPAIKNLRDAYIETAMSTMTHQWLAQWVFPESIIDEVMDKVRAERAAQVGIESKWNENKEEKSKETIYDMFDELDEASFEAYLKENTAVNRRNWRDIRINEAGLDDEGTSIMTKQGDQVLAVDAKNELLLVRVKGTGYQGVLAILKGYTMCSGEEFGKHFDNSRKRLELRNDDKIYIVDASTETNPETRDAVEFRPALIIDGNSLIGAQSAFRSIQPRTVVGQSKDGDILLLVIEGRLIGRSLGIGLPDCTAIMNRYDAYQAMNMDGGTSSVMWYDGEYITKCSNPVIQSRYLPNAWVYGNAA